MQLVPLLTALAAEHALASVSEQVLPGAVRFLAAGGAERAVASCEGRSLLLAHTQQLL